MKILATIATAALIALPGVASATCSWHEQTVQISCADGQTYDQETRTCVSQTS